MRRCVGAAKGRPQLSANITGYTSDGVPIGGSGAGDSIGVNGTTGEVTNAGPPSGSFIFEYNLDHQLHAAAGRRADHSSGGAAVRGVSDGSVS
jgi:hypothetical protein